jgi:hypothetical protein
MPFVVNRLECKTAVARFEHLPQRRIDGAALGIRP